MKKCSLCQTKMILRQYHIPIARNVTGGTLYPPPEGSIEEYPLNITTSYYWECPKCGNIEIVESSLSLPQEK